METIEKYYDVTPKVVLEGQESTIIIRPRFAHAAFPAAEKIAVNITPLDGMGADGTYRNLPDAYRIPPDNSPLISWFLAADGTLHITALFTGEQEFNLTLELTEPGNRDRCDWALKAHETLRFNLYAVKEDLYKLRPFKGDFHMHSDFSDGQESPEYVAARNREMGMDFIAITDHYRYDPSLRAIDYWKNEPIALKLYPGEEVHANKNIVHVVNFGGNFSVNEWIRQNEEQYYAEVAEYAKRLPELAPGQDPFPVAASEWVFDKIREGGGLCIFCHPYWQTFQYVTNEAITTAIFNRRKFDAFELIGGFYPYQWRSNNFQYIRYMEERERGNKFPVVGVSDAHGTDRDAERERLAGWYYTIVLAENDSLASIHQAIRSSNCVAVEQVGSGIPRVFGDFRMVKYVSYLMECYFPRHDELCAIEGKLMVELLGGSENARTALSAIKEQVSDYRKGVYNS